MKKLFLLSIVFAALLLGCGKSGHKPGSDNSGSLDTSYRDDTFKNPILNDSHDPWVLAKDGQYYFLDTKSGHVILYQATRLSYLKYAFYRSMYTPAINQENSNNLNSPEIHYLDGKWYIYYSADNGFEANHRMFVLQTDAADPLQGAWTSQKIAGADDIFATDQTVLEYKGVRYLVWSGWKTADVANTGKQQLYIAKMSDPASIEGSRVMISEPLNAWEKFTYQKSVGGVAVTVTDEINEAPAIVKNPAGDVFLFFSASSCADDGYSLGFLSLKTNGDPLNPADWIKNPSPVFTTNTANKAYAPGHSSFFKSVDGKEDWIVYDANLQPNKGCADFRNVRIQKLNWGTGGLPELGVPISPDTRITKPSGE